MVVQILMVRVVVLELYGERMAGIPERPRFVVEPYGIQKSGVYNQWVADSDPEPINLAYCADPYEYEVKPAIAGGKFPGKNSKRLLMKDGHWESNEDTRRVSLYQLHSGDRVFDEDQGGCGVGDPLDRDIEAVKRDVRDELVSMESALSDYGVVIDPVTFVVDEKATEDLRKEMKAKAKV